MQSVCFIDFQGLKSFKSNNAYSLHMAYISHLIKGMGSSRGWGQGNLPPPLLSENSNSQVKLPNISLGYEF